MKYLTAGDSHGKCLVGIIEGIPYGIDIDEKYINEQMRRRRECMGRSKRQNIEDDRFDIISGLHNGITTGMPIGAILYNKSTREINDSSVFTPSYGDLYGMIKYSSFNSSVIKERTSARETAARVLLFSFAKRFLELLGITVSSDVISCYGSKNKKDFSRIIKKFEEEGDSFGAVFEIRVENLIPCLGGFMEGYDRLESKLSEIIFTIGSIKAVEFGDGINIALKKSSDIIKNPDLLGGIEAGMTTGGPILIRATTRPLAGIRKDVESRDLKTKNKVFISNATSDITSVFAAAVISEYLVSFVIADEIIKKFGSDNFYDIKKQYELWKRKTKKTLKGIKK
jgi:chorismate synthase